MVILNGETQCVLMQWLWKIEKRMSTIMSDDRTMVTELFTWCLVQLSVKIPIPTHASAFRTCQ